MHSRSDNQKGFTLIEILITLLIMGVVTGALYNMYVQSSKTWTCQNIITDVQQSARVAMDVVSRDFTMLGYDAVKDDDYDAVDEANINTITFQYRQDTNVARYTYRLDGTDLKRRIATWDGTSYPNIGTGGTETIVANNISSFTLSYFDSSGSAITNFPLTPTSTPKSSKDIILIKIAIVATSSDTCPLDDLSRTIKLTTEVRPRNIAIGSTSGDNTGPLCPSSFAVSDPQVCGELDYSWTASTAVDIAGYILYYGQSAGSYPSQLDLGSTTTKTLTGLTVGNTYYAKLVGYDESGNESTLDDCSELNKTVTIDAPGIPLNLNATASTTELSPQVFLTWTSNLSNNPDETDITRYEIFRMPHSGGPWKKEGSVNGAAASSYDDNLDEEDKCSTFDYKIRAVTKCTGTPDKKSAFSSVIYGDGAGTDIDPDVPANNSTNTRPSDLTKPSRPHYGGGDVISKAGYKRDFLNWTNPVDNDLSYVSVRYAEALVPPATKNAGIGVENGRLGVFDSDNLDGFGPGAEGMAYTHYGPPGCFTNPYCLNDFTTYSYSLFAVDTCGNVSDAAGTSQTTVSQCGEENAGDTAGPPPTPGDFVVSSCDGYKFTWNRIVDDSGQPGQSSANPVLDLAGYYLYKKEIGVDTEFGAVNASIILNPPTPATTISRSVLAADADDLGSAWEGKRLQYKVYSIDCVREADNLEPTASVAATSDPFTSFGGGTPSDTITVYPGRITFANNTGVIITGDTSVPTGNPDHSSIVKDYYHNSVKLGIENTSYGDVRWDKADISWTYSADAFLKSIYRTDTTDEEEIWTSATPVASGSTVTLTNFEVDGSTASPNTTVPLRFIFTNMSGGVTADQDMRGDTITFENINFTKIFLTDDGGGNVELPSSCADSDVTETVGPIPFNPRVGEEGTKQDVPSDPTSSWAVPDSSGNNAAGEINDVNGTSTVNVTTSLNLDSDASISSATLYYGVTDKTFTNGSSVSTWLPETMIQESGTQYTLYDGTTDNRIPANADERIWYYILLQDSNGNFDRHPEIDSGYFTYDQKEVNYCLDKPEPPTGLNGGTTGNTDASINWTAPTENTDASAIQDDISYDLYRSSTGTGGPFAVVTSDLSAISYDDNGFLNLSSNQYAYKVKAKDDCSGTNLLGGTGPNVSEFSDTWMECVGSGGITVNPDPTSITNGDKISLTVTECGKINTTAGDTITVHVETLNPVNDDDWFDMVEAGDTGIFTISEGGETQITTSITSGCAPTNTCLYIGSHANTSSTIRFTYSAVTADVTAGGNVCLVTPDPPTLSAITVDGDRFVDLSWTEPTMNTYGLLNYDVEQSIDGAAFTYVGTVIKGTTSARVIYTSGTPSIGTGSGTGVPKRVKDSVMTYRMLSRNTCAIESGYSNTRAESHPL